MAVEDWFREFQLAVAAEFHPKDLSIRQQIEESIYTRLPDSPLAEEQERRLIAAANHLVSNREAYNTGDR